MFMRKYWIPLSVFIVAIVGVSLYYLQTRLPKDPILIVKPVEFEKQKAKSPVEQSEQVEHLRADPSEPFAAPSEVSKSEVSREVSTAPEMDYSKGAGNPPPFDKVPIDLWDFEATKAAMIENINFVKANWHPFEYNREVSIASAISHNIANAANATDLGLFTPEQALELTLLFSGLLEFKGHEPGRTLELREQGYTHKEAIQIAAEELLERQKQQWGVK